uniref:Uncharacterized protein n=1 Tax=Setaria viridis TaxID=4556 RepID=A0A4U6WJI4_SETVI|nr:hypothetical protein SEVIR_1G104650v2 [Setaria viridis]
MVMECGGSTPRDGNGGSPGARRPMAGDRVRQLAGRRRGSGPSGPTGRHDPPPLTARGVQSGRSNLACPVVHRQQQQLPPSPVRFNSRSWLAGIDGPGGTRAGTGGARHRTAPEAAARPPAPMRIRRRPRARSATERPSPRRIPHARLIIAQRACRAWGMDGLLCHDAHLHH